MRRTQSDTVVSPKIPLTAGVLLGVIQTVFCGVERLEHQGINESSATQTLISDTDMVEPPSRFNILSTAQSLLLTKLLNWGNKFWLTWKQNLWIMVNATECHQSTPQVLEMWQYSDRLSPAQELWNMTLKVLSRRSSA